MHDIGQTELERLRDVIGKRLGLQFSNDGLETLAGAARKRLEANHLSSAGEYVERLEQGASLSQELPALAELLTVSETFFFRGQEHFRALAAELGERPLEPTSQVRLLSAGCASGEEPYSLAISLHEAFPALERGQFVIDACDVNAAMLVKAERAIYSSWSLRATSDVLKNRYFKQHGRDFALDEQIRTLVRFELRNLVDEWPPLGEGAGYDAIFCRNVLMYFAPAVAKRVVERFARALAPGGLLFLGHAETLRGLSNDFHLCHTHDAFYYRKRGEHDEPDAAREVRSTQVSLPEVESSLSWPIEIAHAAQRIQTLAVRSRDFFAARTQETDTNLATILALVHEERFAEALSQLRALPEAALGSRDALLLLALALTNRGACEEAEATCRRLLQIDELNAGAHYLLALCREQAGERAAAIECDRTAIYLDPTFAMPHLHLGLLAKRSRDVSLAQRELEQALRLLDNEDAARLLLFGGGFSREALMKLCASELASVGARG